MKPLGGLWKNKSKAGTDYLSGILDAKRLKELWEMSGNGEKSIKILIFRNAKKESDKHPDYQMQIDEASPMRTKRDFQEMEEKKSQTVFKTAPDEEDSIPF